MTVDFIQQYQNLNNASVMSENGSLKINFKINDGKTEMLIVTSSRNKERILRRTSQIKVGNEIIKPSPVVRNLEAYFDGTIGMVPQVNNCIKNIYYHLRRISGIRRHLNNDTCAKFIHAFVTSVTSRFQQRITCRITTPNSLPNSSCTK